MLKTIIHDGVPRLAALVLLQRLPRRHHGYRIQQLRTRRFL
jgi:hypothetical protein